MKGDFSRLGFDRRKGYTAVLEQQGRVGLDADANSQRFIDEHLSRSGTVDVVGEYGAPADDAGFEIIVVSDDELVIGAGRYYVDGLLCENPATVCYDSQPFLLDPAESGASLLSSLAQGAGDTVIQVYLEVWQRLVTALDDPCLREPALGQADTTVRLQTVWRVVADLTAAATEPEPPIPGTAGMTACCRQMYAIAAQPSTGTMSATTSGPAADCGCEPVAAAGYQGIENQLYRIEIHEGGDETTATFKVSRENGSVVSAVTGISGATVQLSSLGADANLGFATQQWVELTDDTYLFGQVPNQPGTLYQIQSIQPTDQSVTLTGTVAPVDPGQNARLRRWDQAGPSATSAGVPLSAGSWLPLENGIQVSFAAGTYQSGDYWTIPARAATGQIEWPPCGSDQNAFQSPTSVLVHRAPLACVHWTTATDGQGAFTVDDCRQKFSPLTAISSAAAGQAIHVEGINWVNDDITTLDQLVASGLVVSLDQTPSGPVTGASFIVTVEPATPPASFTDVAGADRELRLQVQLPSTIARSVTTVDAEISVANQAISWLLPYDGAPILQQLAIAYLNALISAGAPDQLFARLRIKLLGKMIFASGAAGPIYLDGQAFGQAALRQDGVTPRTDLRFPSGDEATSSDFDGWLYVAPTLMIDSPLNIPYQTLTVVVNFFNQVTSVDATVDGQTVTGVTPTATVILNYPAVAASSVTLALTGTSGVGTVASIPASQPIEAGQASVTFPITILSNPGAATTLTFEISATLGAAAGPASAQGGSFTVTGVAPPPFPIIGGLESKE
jgi:hypothetical protein